MLMISTCCWKFPKQLLCLHLLAYAYAYAYAYALVETSLKEVHTTKVL